MTDQKQCTYCMEWFPEDDEHFYKANGGKNFRPECKYCFDYEQALKKKQKKLHAEVDQWKEEMRKQTFICTWCGQPKKFDQMRTEPKLKRVEPKCKACWQKKKKEVYDKNTEARLFAQVLKERREMKNE